MLHGKSTSMYSKVLHWSFQNAIQFSKLFMNICSPVHTAIFENFEAIISWAFISLKNIRSLAHRAWRNLIMTKRTRLSPHHFYLSWGLSWLSWKVHKIWLKWIIYFVLILVSSRFDCPLSNIERKPSVYLKFEKPNGKIPKYKDLLTSVKSWCPHPPTSLESSMKRFDRFLWRFTVNRNKTNQNKWKSMTILIVLHLKPKTLLY